MPCVRVVEGRIAQLLEHNHLLSHLPLHACPAHSYFVFPEDSLHALFVMASLAAPVAIRQHLNSPALPLAVAKQQKLGFRNSTLLSSRKVSTPSLPSSRNSVTRATRSQWSPENRSGLWSQRDFDVSTDASSKEIWSIKREQDTPTSPFMSGGAYAGQGQPSPMLQERFQSVISQLFQNRIIRCGGAVDDDMANLIVAQLLYLDAADPNKDIIMYVNSPGGSVTAGMAIFDTMRHIRPAVSTVCVGLAASMGAFLLSAGTKGKRFSLPNSRIMIHQPLGGAQGQQTDIEIQANEILHHKANLNGYLSYHTGQTYEKITQDTDRDFFMSAKEAQQYGLIDAVISNPLKALKPQNVLTPV